MNFISSLYKLFNWISSDADVHLRGLDEVCNDYTGANQYTWNFFLILVTGAVFYCLMYHLLASSTRNRRKHWWMYAGILSVLNFAIAFFPFFNAINTESYCLQLVLTASDAVKFAVMNVLWGFLWFVLLTSSPIPRLWSNHCRAVTFWKPN